MLNMLKVSVLPRAQKQQTIHGLLKKSGFQQEPLFGKKYQTPKGITLEGLDNAYSFTKAGRGTTWNKFQGILCSQTVQGPNE